MTISYSNGDFHVPFSISVFHSLLHMLQESTFFFTVFSFIIYSTSSFYFILFRYHKALSYFIQIHILEKHIFLCKIPSPTLILLYNTYTLTHTNISLSFSLTLLYCYLGYKQQAIFPQFSHWKSCSESYLYCCCC